jgi:hypothetical protein
MHRSQPMPTPKVQPLQFLKNIYSSNAIFNVDKTGFALGTTLSSKVLINRGDTIAFKKISGR